MRYAAPQKMPHASEVTKKTGKAAFMPRTMSSEHTTPQPGRDMLSRKVAIKVSIVEDDPKARILVDWINRAEGLRCV